MVKHHLPDIDIDCADREHVLNLIKHIPARLAKDDRRHASGVYVTKIPYDPINGCAALDYIEAERRGYFKIDLLNVSVYTLVRNPDHYEQMLNRDPQWDLLWTNRELSSKVVHVGNYWDLLVRLKPDSVKKLAAFVSIVRPGKSHLQHRNWDEIFSSVWDGDTSEGYTYKKSHAFSYGMLIKLHLNLLSEYQSS